MRTILTIAVLALLALPTHAAAQTIDQSEEAVQSALPSPSEPVLPSHDVPLYVPLTDDQQDYPTLELPAGVDYYPGIERPATPPAKKAITDQVPQ